MKRKIIAALFWCLGKLGVRAMELNAFDEAVTRVRPFVDEANKLEFVDSGYKHSWVYQNCVHKYPDMNRQDIGLAIELAVRQWH